MTPVTLVVGGDFATKALGALEFREIGGEATILLTTDSEAVAAGESDWLPLAFLSEEWKAFGATSGRFGNARRPRDGENVFLRPLTAR
jgi:hypothetical protein